MGWQLYAGQPGYAFEVGGNVRFDQYHLIARTGDAVDHVIQAFRHHEVGEAFIEQPGSMAGTPRCQDHLAGHCGSFGARTMARDFLHDEIHGFPQVRHGLHEVAAVILIATTGDAGAGRRQQSFDQQRGRRLAATSGDRDEGATVGGLRPLRPNAPPDLAQSTQPATQALQRPPEPECACPLRVGRRQVEGHGRRLRAHVLPHMLLCPRGATPRAGFFALQIPAPCGSRPPRNAAGRI